MTESRPLDATSDDLSFAGMQVRDAIFKAAEAISKTVPEELAVGVLAACAGWIVHDEAKRRGISLFEAALIVLAEIKAVAESFA